MASASSTSAKSLFAESKFRLADRVQMNINNVGSLARQIQRGSKTSEVIYHNKINNLFVFVLNNECNCVILEVLCSFLRL